MLATLSITSSIFITILLGMLCGWSKLFHRGHDQILIKYVFYIALPANLFLSCYKAKWHIFNFAYLTSYILAALLIGLLSYFLSRRKFNSSSTASLINSLLSTQVGVGLFTMPLFMQVFKSTHLAMPLMLWQSVVFMTLGIFALQLNDTTTPRQRNFVSFIPVRIIKVIFTSPVIVLSLLGLTLGSLQIPLPQFASTSAKFVGDTLSAVALFSLGLSVAFNFKALRNLRQIALISCLSIIKLLLFPLIALAVGYLFKLSTEYLLALVLFCASPTAAHTYIIAKRYNAESELATFSVVFTTILSFISINLWLYWLN